MRSHFPEHLELEYRRLLTRQVARLARQMVPAIRKNFKEHPVKTDEDFLERLAKILDEMRGTIQPSDYVKAKLAQIFGNVGEWTTKETVNVFKNKKGVSKLSIDLAVAQVEALRESDIIQNYAEGFLRTNLELVELAGNEYIEGIYTIAKDGYLNGSSLKQMTEQMKEYTNGDISKAEFWATDQIGDAWSDYNKAAHKAAGVTTYRWRTMGDQRVRDEHQELNNQSFTWERGAADTGLLAKPGAKHPGQDYRCITGDMKLSFNSDIVRCYRRWFTGKLTEIITVSNKLIRVTGNHPILTPSGWCPANKINVGDYIVEVPDKTFNGCKLNINNCEATAEKVFNAALLAFSGERVGGLAAQFHGDGLVDYEVDVVSVNGDLSIKGNSVFFERLGKFFFAIADKMRVRFIITRLSNFYNLLFSKFFPPDGIVGLLSNIKSFLFRHFRHSNDVCFGAGSRSDTVFKKPTPDGHSGDTVFSTTGEFAYPAQVIIHKGGFINNFSVVHVVGVRHINYSGFVYNFETKNNIYFVNGLSTHNCRCYSEPIFPGEE